LLPCVERYKRSSERLQVSRRRVRCTAQGAVRGESRGGYWEGETSESLNPMDGFDMK